MRVLISGSGNIFNFRTKEKYDLCIAADGGIHFLIENDIKPDVLIGDMDSISVELLENLPKGIEVIKYPAEKDFTDLELALKYAFEKKATEITLVGITGMRLDHVLNNLNMAYGYFKKGVHIKLIDKNNTLFFLKTGDYVLNMPSKYVYLSLIPWRNDVVVKKLEGVKYPLKDTMLFFGTGHGVSNECLGDRFEIEVGLGEVLIVFSNEDTGNK